MENHFLVLERRSALETFFKTALGSILHSHYLPTYYLTCQSFYRVTTALEHDGMSKGI